MFIQCNTDLFALGAYFNEFSIVIMLSLYYEIK